MCSPEENPGSKEMFEGENLRAEIKRKELIRRIDIWKGNPDPWRILGCITLVDDNDREMVFQKMYFTAHDARYIYDNVGVKYRLPLIFYLILDEVFLRHNLEWVNKKVYSLGKESKSSLIVLQMKTKLQKHKKQNIVDGKEKCRKSLISAYGSKKMIRSRP